MKVSIAVTLRDAVVLDSLRAQLLDTVEEVGSITAAARKLPVSYAHAWHLIRDLTLAIGQPLLESSSAGSRLTAAGREVLALYRSIEQGARHGSATPLSHLRNLVRKRGG